MIHTLFPSQIYYAPLTRTKNKQFNQDLINESWRISEIDIEAQKWCEKNYPGGFTSYSSMCRLNQMSSTFLELQKKIDKHVSTYIKSMEMDITVKDLTMTTCWVNIMPPGVTHSMHIHPLSVISGTYYLQTPKNCSAIKFEDPRMVNFMASPPRKSNAHRDNQRFVSMPAKVGHVVLFESWMRHEVPPNLANEPRISISFNYDWI